VQRREVVGAGLALLAGGAMQAAQPATLTVFVLTPGGQPAPGVVVEVVAPGAPRRVPEQPVVITQLGLRFVPAITAVPAGSTVRFVNEDGFEHHLRSLPAGPLGSIAPAQQFDVRMAAARADNIPGHDVVFERPGLVVLGCHFHASMRGHVYVGESTLLGVSDAAGRATIAAVPAGSASVRLWHPEQLLEQPALALQMPGPTQVTATLNFQPRPPRGRPR
jgi:plastocyanin